MLQLRKSAQDNVSAQPRKMQHPASLPNAMLILLLMEPMLPEKAIHECPQCAWSPPRSLRYNPTSHE
jgi:hypothetical protein